MPSERDKEKFGNRGEGETWQSHTHPRKLCRRLSCLVVAAATSAAKEMEAATSSLEEVQSGSGKCLSRFQLFGLQMEKPISLKVYLDSSGGTSVTEGREEKGNEADKNIIY